MPQRQAENFELREQLAAMQAEIKCAEMAEVASDFHRR